MLRLIFVVAGCAVVLAACGSSTGGGRSTAAGTGTAVGAKSAADTALEFARCMRAHGLPTFPDPTPGVGFQFSLGSGVNPQSPAFQAAQQACRRFAPKGGRPPTMTPSQRRAEFAFARCLRSHGEPNFPDPSNGAPGNGPAIVLHGMIFAVGTGFDPRSTAFKQAAADCGIGLPKGAPHGG